MFGFLPIKQQNMGKLESEQFRKINKLRKNKENSF
jgi:hypothetical protein